MGVTRVKRVGFLLDHTKNLPKGASHVVFTQKRNTCGRTRKQLQKTGAPSPIQRLLTYQTCVKLAKRAIAQKLFPCPLTDYLSARTHVVCLIIDKISFCVNCLFDLPLTLLVLIYRESRWSDSS